MPAAITLPVDLDLSGAPRQIAEAINRVQRSIPKIRLDVDGRPLGKITGDIKEFDKSLQSSNARVIAFGATTGILYGISQAFTNLVKSTIDVEKKLQSINVIAGGTQASFDRLSKSIFTSAKNTASSFQEAASAAEEFARQGLSVEESAKRANDALILARLSGSKAADAVRDLTSAMNTFKGEALDTSAIINKLATVDANFAVSQKDLSDAMQRVGSSAQDAGVSFDKLLGIITSVAQTTGRTGSTIGNGLKTIFTRVNSAPVLAALKGIGVEFESMPGKLLPADQILENLAKRFVTLGDVQRNQIARQVAGIQQINVLKALLGDAAKGYSILSQATRDSSNATNEAILRNEELNKTLGDIIQIAGTNITNLFSKIGSITIAPTLKGLIGLFNDLFESTSNRGDGKSLGTQFGEDLLRGIASSIAGPGKILILAVFTKLIGSVVGFALKSVKQLAGLNNASEKQSQIQSQINGLLSTGNSYYVKRLAEAKSIADQETIVLQLIKAQNAEVQRQSAQFAGVAARRNGSKADGPAGFGSVAGLGGTAGLSRGPSSSSRRGVIDVTGFASGPDIRSRNLLLVNEALSKMKSRVESIAKIEADRLNVARRDVLQQKSLAGEKLTPAEKGFLTRQGKRDRLGELGISESAAKFVGQTPAGRRFLDQNVNQPVRRGNQALYAKSQQNLYIQDILSQFQKESKKGLFSGGLFSAGGVENRINKKYGNKLGSEARGVLTDNTAALRERRGEIRQSLALNASFLVPLIAEQTKRIFGVDPESRGGRVSSGIIEGVATGGLVASLAPKNPYALGAAGLIAAFSSLRSITSNVGQSLEQFTKKLSETNGQITEQEQAISQSIAAFDDLKTIVSSGGSADAVLRQTKVFTENLSKIPEGPQKAALTKAFANNDIEAAQNAIGDSTITNSRIKKVNEFISRLATFNEKAGSSTSLIGRLIAPSRTSLVESVQNPNAKGASFTEKALATFGLGVNKDNISTSLPRMSADNLTKIKGQVGSLPFSSRINPEELEGLIKKNVNPSEIIKKIFEASQIPTEEVDRAIAQGTNIEDTREILNEIIKKIKTNAKSPALAKELAGYEQNITRLVKVTEDIFSGVAYQLDQTANRTKAQRSRFLTGAQAGLDLKKNSLTPKAFADSQLQINNLKTEDSTANAISKIISESLKKINIPQEQLSRPETANDIARIVDEIIKNPGGLSSSIDKLETVLQQGSTNRQTLKSVGGIKGDLNRDIGGELANRDEELLNNKLERRILEEQNSRNKKANFFGGDSLAIRGRDLSSLTRGLDPASMRQTLNPIYNKTNNSFDNFFNPSRNYRAETERNASVLGERAQSLINLDKEKLLPDSGPERDKYAEVIRKAMEANLTYGIDQLESSGLPKDLIKNLRGQVSGAAKVQQEEAFPTDQKGYTDRLASQVKEQRDQATNQYTALIGNSGALNTNSEQLKALQEELKKLNESYSKSTGNKMDLIGPKAVGEATSQADGHIPNFSAFAREMSAIRNGVGGARTGDKPVSANIRGLGSAVVNSGEKIVRNFLGTGKDAVFNRNMINAAGGKLGSFGNVQNVANGYVPNFALPTRGLYGSDLAKKLRAERAYTLDHYGGGLTDLRPGGLSYIDPSRIKSLPRGANFLDFGFSVADGSIRADDSRARLIPKLLNKGIAKDKSLEALNSEYLPKSIPVEELRRKYGIKGNGKLAQAQLKAAAEKELGLALFKDKYGAQSKGIRTTYASSNPIQNDLSHVLDKSKNYFAQKYTPLATNSAGVPFESRVHVVVDGNGKAKVVPYATVDKGQPGVSNVSVNRSLTPDIVAQEKVAQRAVQSLAGKDPKIRNAAFGPDILRYDPEFAQAANKISQAKGGFNQYERTPFSLRELLRGQQRRYYGVGEFNPSNSAGASGFFDQPLATEGYHAAIKGRLPEGVSAASHITQSLKYGYGANLRNLLPENPIGALRGGLSSLRSGIVSGTSKGLDGLKSAGAAAGKAGRFTGNLGLQVGVALAGQAAADPALKLFGIDGKRNLTENQSFLPDYTAREAAGDIAAIAPMLGFARLGGVKGAAGYATYRAFDKGGDYLQKLLAGKGDIRGLDYGDAVKGVTNSLGLAAAGGVSGGTKGALLGSLFSLGAQGVGAYNSYNSTTQFENATLDDYGIQQIIDLAKTNPQLAAKLKERRLNRRTKRNYANAPLTLNPEVEANTTATNNNLPTSPEVQLNQVVKDLGLDNKYAQSRGYRDEAQRQNYINGGSLYNNLSVSGTNSPMPINAVGIDNGYYIDENGNKIGRVNLAKGYIPNFSALDRGGYNQRSIRGRKTRKAIRAVGGVIDRGPKSLGPLNILQSMIKNGNIDEAKRYINENGLPDRFTSSGYGSNDLGALYAAIEREKSALIGRGISRNLAEGYVFVGNRPEIGGMGVGNYIDEPAGKYNPALGIQQGINRVKSQGGNPRHSGVPNYASNKVENTTDELINVIKALIDTLSQGKIADRGIDSRGVGAKESGSVQVDHNITVNASISGEINSNNADVQGIIDSQIAELKVRLLALEASQKGNRNFVPRPPGSSNVNI